MAKWKEVKRISLPWDYTNVKYRTVIEDGDVIIQRQEDEWIDITSECEPCYVESSCVDGWYMKLCHKGDVVALFRPDGEPEVKQGYRIDKVGPFSFQAHKRMC